MAEQSNHPAIFAGLLGSAAWGVPQVATAISLTPGGPEIMSSMVSRFLMGCAGGALLAGAALYGYDILTELRERKIEGEQLQIARGGDRQSAGETAVLTALKTAEAIEPVSATGPDEERVYAPRRKANHPAQPSPAPARTSSESVTAEIPVMRSLPTRDSKDPLVARATRGAVRPASHPSRSMTKVGYALATRIPEIDATAGPTRYTAPVTQAQAGYPPYGSGRWSTGSLEAAREAALASEAETTGDLGRARTGQVTVDMPAIPGQKSSPDRRIVRRAHTASQGGGRHFSAPQHAQKMHAPSAGHFSAPQQQPQPQPMAAQDMRPTGADDTFAQMNMQSFGVRDAASQARNQSVSQVLAARLGGDALGAAPASVRATPRAHQRPRFDGEHQERASYISSHVAEVDEGMFPERRSMDDLDNNDVWEEALSAMGERLGERRAPVFHDMVGGPGTIDEPDGLEGPTGFIPFRVPAAHPEVVDTRSYVDYLLRDEFSQNSSKALRRSAHSHLRVIEGGTTPMRLRHNDTTSTRKSARHFAPTDLAKEA